MFGSLVRRITKPRRKSIALGLLAAGLFVLLWSQVVRFHRTGIIAVQRAQTANQLGDRVLTLRLTIEKRLAAAESLAAFLRVTPAADLPADLPPFLRQIYERTPHLRAIWAAPDGVITYLYPERGNQALRNLDLKHDARPEVRGTVDLALRTGKLTITPPHPLIQGGTGITARLAAEGPDGGWWLVGVCADFSALLEEAGFDANGSPLLIAVRGPDGKVAYGPSSIFSARPVLKSLDLGGGRWEFGAVPAAGWGASTEASSAFHWTIGGIIALLLFCSVYLVVNRRERLRAGILENTATIARLNEELQEELSARRETEARFSSFMRYLPAVAFLRDRDGRYVYVNEAWERYSGMTAAQVLGKSAGDVLPADEARTLQEEDAQILAGEELIWDEANSFLGDRESWWISSKFPVRDTEGRTNLVGGISIEVTDRKRTDEALRASEQRYRAILENMEEGYYEVDLQGNLTFANSAFYRTFGRPEQELLGASYRSVMTPDTAERILSTFHRIFQTGQAERGTDWEIFLPDGSIRAFEASASPIQVSEGRYSGFRGVVRDVTDRRTAEQALAESEERYRTLFEHDLAGVYLTRLEGGLIECNQAFATMFGFGSPAEAMAAGEHRFSSDPAQFARFSAGLQREGSVSHQEVVARRKDGSLFYALESASLIHGKNGDAMIEGTLVDISERRAVEQALAESEERYRTLFGSASDAIFILDEAGRIIEANEATSERLGYSREELIRMRITDLDDAASASLARERGEELMRDGSGLFEVIHVRKDGTTVPTEASAKLIHYAGSPALLVIARDITERKRAEEALRESEARYRKLFERNLAGVYKTSLDGRLLDCNAAFAAMLGAAGPEALIHTSILDRYADPSARLPFIEMLKREGRVTGMEARLLRLDGKPIHVLISAALVHDEPGHVQIIEGSIIDITAREALARERLRARGLETIGAIAGGVAHEVRNPLFAIQVNLEALARRFSPEAEARSFLDNVLEHARRLNSLMQSLLELGQASSHEAILLSDPRQLVAEAVALVEEDDLRGRITTTFCDRPEPFRADPKRIVKALLHILDNAARVSPPDGAISVACVCKDGVCAISISDQGPGLPPSIRDRLFEPFVTAGTNRRGLGLALARHYVESSGGTVEAANNDPPPGATFTVRLPLASP
ncbi:MAG: PAS domain S-box protein [Acidobacteriota bacterium]